MILITFALKESRQTGSHDRLGEDSNNARDSISIWKEILNIEALSCKTIAQNKPKQPLFLIYVHLKQAHPFSKNQREGFCRDSKPLQSTLLGKREWIWDCTLDRYVGGALRNASSIRAYHTLIIFCHHFYTSSGLKRMNATCPSRLCLFRSAKAERSSGLSSMAHAIIFYDRSALAERKTHFIATGRCMDSTCQLDALME